MKRFLSPIFLFAIIIILFWQFFFKGFLPIPSDTIVGLYYPFREIYSKTNPNGVPFKNFLITDPVRQQYPWKNLATSIIKKGHFPTWNPYNFAGTPLLANFQSSPFYPLNILLFLFPFEITWSIFIFIQPLLAGLFLYFYLNNLKLKKLASLLGAITFSLCGFSTAWMEWGTIIHTALWIPLILLSIDKIVSSIQYRVFSIKNKSLFIWSFLFVFSIASSFLAGHLQIFFYLYIFSIVYFLARWMNHKKNKNTLFAYLALNTLFVILTSIQWIPALKFISLSARSLDIVDWRLPGWFIPWQNIVQFAVPDFFGNPTTLNYWGVWNYAEFIGYVGIFPLLMSFFALFFRRDKKTFFFGTVFFVALIFALPTFLAKIPFELKIPFISTSQPTRLIFIIDFSLSVLCALGLDYFIRIKNRLNIIYILGFFSVVFVGFWAFVLVPHNLLALNNLRVIKQNLIFPTGILLASSLLTLSICFFPNKIKYRTKAIRTFFILLILLTTFDLLRFSWKFTPFTKKEYLFPSTSITSFLQKQKEPFRIMVTDDRILPPNFSIMYKLQALDGYDPLYLQRYGEFIAASERNKPNINSPFGFNRIITPKNYSSRIYDFLNVKYVLSMDEINFPKLKEVLRNGSIIIYENIQAMPRAFFVKKTSTVGSKQDAINFIFDENNKLNEAAVIEGNDVPNKSWSLGKTEIVKYNENKIILKTVSPGIGFLVLTDSYYPTWHVKIDGREEKIYLTDFNFRGIIVPEGKHTVEFYNTIF